MNNFKVKGFMCGTDVANQQPEITSSMPNGYFEQAYTFTYYYERELFNEDKIRKQKIRQDRLKKLKRINGQNQ